MLKNEVLWIRFCLKKENLEAGKSRKREEVENEKHVFFYTPRKKLKRTDTSHSTAQEGQKQTGKASYSLSNLTTKRAVAATVAAAARGGGSMVASPCSKIAAMLCYPPKQPTTLSPPVYPQGNESVPSHLTRSTITSKNISPRGRLCCSSTILL